MTATSAVEDSYTFVGIDTTGCASTRYPTCPRTIPIPLFKQRSPTSSTGSPWAICRTPEACCGRYLVSELRLILYRMLVWLISKLTRLLSG